MSIIRTKTYRGSRTQNVSVKYRTKTGTVTKRIPVRTSYVVTVKTKR